MKPIFLALALAAATVGITGEGNAAKISLKCRTHDYSGLFDLNIDLDNRRIELSQNTIFEILQVREKAITGLMINPRQTNGEEIIVLNRETGNLMWTKVSLSSGDNGSRSCRGYWARGATPDQRAQ